MPSPLSTATATTLLLLAVAVTATGWLAFTPSGQVTIKYIWEGDKEGARKKVAMKQLNFLKKELSYLGARIERAARQVEEAFREVGVSKKGRKDRDGGDGGEDGEEEGWEESAASTSAYYHFSSSGKKFKNKWDEYDVEEELRRLEREDEKEAEEGGAQTTIISNGNENGEVRHRGGGSRRWRENGNGREGGREGGKPTWGRMRTEVGQLQSDLEKAMGHLDSVRGDEEVKQRRKGLVLESHALFQALDAVTQRLI